MDRKSAGSKDLELAKGVRAPDAFEQIYMGGAGVVLYRDRHRAPWRLHAVSVGLAGIVAASALAAGQSLGLVLGLPAVALFWLLFSVLRVIVSTRHVKVRYGLFGVRIPVAAIESLEVITYDWLRGWRSRRARGNRRWFHRLWPGHGYQALRIAWRDRKGDRRVTVIGSRHADVLASQIDQARSVLPADVPPPALGSSDDP